MSLPPAQPLESLSPSRVKDLTECQLRVAFKQHATGSAVPSDAQIVGNSLHAALKDFVKEREFEREDSLLLIESRFLSQLEERAPGREVLGVRLAAARLKRMAGRVTELIAEAGDSAVTLSEQYLEARDGRLQGVVDLIIDSQAVHLIVDYKTGQAIDEAGNVVEQFATQLRLYAVLEHERSGRWPQRGVLLRFGGPAVSVDLDPAECQRTADRLLAALVAYNALAGTVPTGNASEATCMFCSFAPYCPAFWGAISPSWARGAIRGRVLWVETSAGDTLTIRLEGASGSYEGIVTILGLTERQLSSGPPAVGDELVICGVRPDSDGRLHPDRAARVAVTGPADRTAAAGQLR